MGKRLSVYHLPAKHIYQLRYIYTVFSLFCLAHIDKGNSYAAIRKGLRQNINTVVVRDIADIRFILSQAAKNSLRLNTQRILI